MLHGSGGWTVTQPQLIGSQYIGGGEWGGAEYCIAIEIGFATGGDDTQRG